MNICRVAYLDHLLICLRYFISLQSQLQLCFDLSLFGQHLLRVLPDLENFDPLMECFFDGTDQCDVIFEQFSQIEEIIVHLLAI